MNKNQKLRRIIQATMEFPSIKVQEECEVHNIHIEDHSRLLDLINEAIDCWTTQEDDLDQYPQMVIDAYFFNTDLYGEEL
jgi:hypothetical protein